MRFLLLSVSGWTGNSMVLGVSMLVGTLLLSIFSGQPYFNIFKFRRHFGDILKGDSCFIL